MGEMPKGARQFSSRDFNQNTGEAKKAADHGPVFITDRGEPAYVLLKIEDYEVLTNQGQSFLSLADALEQKGASDFDFEIPERSKTSTLREPDLS